MNSIHTLQLNLDWNLIDKINKIDRFDASWELIERKKGKEFRYLKTIATVRSVGASTRIEGSSMTDEEVDVLLSKINIDHLEDRDSQEVMGYFQAMDLITGQFQDIDISENSIRHLHNVLMNFSQKDQWHKGDYKKQSNSVEASFPDGKKQIIFQTTPPGVETQAAMRSLLDWYDQDKQTHILVKSALFIYDFLSIHPFQDGNGRMSRLLSTLLLLKNGYSWIQYVSFEHEIENQKVRYYRVLRECQSQRPGEEVTPWLNFFLDSLKNIQNQLMKKIEELNNKAMLSSKEKTILFFIHAHPGCQSGIIAQKLAIPQPTVKRLLKGLVEKNKIEKFGSGRGTSYEAK